MYNDESFLTCLIVIGENIPLCFKQILKVNKKVNTNGKFIYKLVKHGDYNNNNK